MCNWRLASIASACLLALFLAGLRSSWLHPGRPGVAGALVLTECSLKDPRLAAVTVGRSKANEGPSCGVTKTELKVQLDVQEQAARPWYADTPVDVVVTWVNASDPGWRQELNKFYNATRYPKGALPDRGEVYLCLAAIQRYAPWVRRIYVVTMGQQLTRLQLLSQELQEKVEVVDHKSFIPGEFLPTFNTMVIEMFLHRIPGLQEHFLYLNDDMWLSRPFSRERFFAESPGMSNVFLSSSRHWQRIYAEPPPQNFEPGAWRWVYYNAGQLLAQQFGGVQPRGWHAGFVLRRSAYKAAWAIFGEAFNRTASHRLRHYAPWEQGGDLSPIPLAQYSALELGMQAPRLARYAEIARDATELPSGYFQASKGDGPPVDFTLCQAFARLSSEAAKSVCAAIVGYIAVGFDAQFWHCICSEPEVGGGCRVAGTIGYGLKPQHFLKTN